MSKKKQEASAKASSNKDKSGESKLKVLKDFTEFGRITVEDLNDFFDSDVMDSLTAHAKRHRERRLRRN